MYPNPDRSKKKRNFKATDDSPHVDCGWTEGLLTDGRPYRAEQWSWEGATFINFHFSSIGLEAMTTDEWPDWLEREGLLRFLDRRRAFGKHYTDPSGNAMWELNVCAASEDKPLVDEHLGFHNYKRPSPPAAQTRMPFTPWQLRSR